MQTTMHQETLDNIRMNVGDIASEDIDATILDLQNWSVDDALGYDQSELTNIISELRESLRAIEANATAILDELKR